MNEVTRAGIQARQAKSRVAFQGRLAGIGAELIEPEWLGKRAYHRARCAAGHIYSLTPDSIRVGNGHCPDCANEEPSSAAARFKVALAELGATLLEPKWLGLHRRHHVRCDAGHDCYPRPNTVLYNGQGICRDCVGLSPAISEANFRARLAELGVTLLEPYKNATSKHRARCSQGHECWPVPHSLQRGNGACRDCAGQDPVRAEKEFRARVTEQGGTVVGQYVNSSTPVHIVCAQGHHWSPRPGVIQRGHGICRECAYKTWDVFYVVAHKSEAQVKFGISNLDGRVRLRNHRGYGYTNIVRLVTGLPGRLARDTEDAVRSALALAGEQAVQGREYFDVSCLALILDVADSWLATSEAQPMKGTQMETSRLDLAEDEEFEGEDDELVRAKWAIDGATTLAEAAQKAREFADHLQDLHDQGYVLREPVADDYGAYYKP